jgi:SSS family solute:Na+ symporter
MSTLDSYAFVSAIMSTLDSYAFVSAVTIGKDIIGQIGKKKSQDIVKLTKTGLIITAILSILIAILIPSAIDIIYKTSSIAIPGLLFPVIMSYSTKYTIKPNTVLLTMITPSTITLIWTLISVSNIEISSFFREFEPMFPGILISLLFGVFLIRKQKVKEYEKNI